MDTVDIKTWRFSGFLDTLYPDKPFIHHNPSMWQHSTQTTPRLWSHDSGLLLIVKTERGRCSCVMLQWSKTWRRHCTKTKTFSQLCTSCSRCPPSLQRTSAGAIKEGIVEITFSVMQKLCRCNPLLLDICAYFTCVCPEYVEKKRWIFHTLPHYVNSRNDQRRIESIVWHICCSSEKTDLQEAALEIGASSRLVLWSPWRTGIQL